MQMHPNRFTSKNLTDALLQLQSYERHQKKLNEIRLGSNSAKRTKSKKKIPEKTTTELNKSRVVSIPKNRGPAFHEIAKVNEVKRNNQILLDRLLEISKGKQISVTTRGTQRKIPPRSLNYVRMKREAEKIDQENQRLLQRILKQSSDISKKKFDESYVKNAKYLHNIQKSAQEPLSKMVFKHDLRRTTHLPPLGMRDKSEVDQDEAQSKETDDAPIPREIKKDLSASFSGGQTGLNNRKNNKKSVNTSLVMDSFKRNESVKTSEKKRRLSRPTEKNSNAITPEDRNLNSVGRINNTKTQSQGNSSQSDHPKKTPKSKSQNKNIGLQENQKKKSEPNVSEDIPKKETQINEEGKKPSNDQSKKDILPAKEEKTDENTSEVEETVNFSPSPKKVAKPAQISFQEDETVRVAPRKEIHEKKNPLPQISEQNHENENKIEEKSANNATSI